MCTKILTILNSKTVFIYTMIYTVCRYDTPQCTSQPCWLGTLQVIVKSYWQYTSLDETMKTSTPAFYVNHHFRVKFYAANIIFTCI